MLYILKVTVTWPKAQRWWEGEVGTAASMKYKASQAQALTVSNLFADYDCTIYIISNYHYISKCTVLFSQIYIYDNIAIGFNLAIMYTVFFLLEP